MAATINTSNKLLFLQQIAPQSRAHTNTRYIIDLISLHQMYATSTTLYYCAAKIAITHTKEGDRREFDQQHMNNDDELKIVVQFKPSSVSRLNVEHQLNESEYEHFTISVHTCMHFTNKYRTEK